MRKEEGKLMIKNTSKRRRRRSEAKKKRKYRGGCGRGRGRAGQGGVKDVGSVFSDEVEIVMTVMMEVKCGDNVKTKVTVVMDGIESEYEDREWLDWWGGRGTRWLQKENVEIEDDIGIGMCQGDSTTNNKASPEMCRSFTPFYSTLSQLVASRVSTRDEAQSPSLYWTRQSLLLVNKAREMGRRGAREGQGTAAGKVGEGDGMRGRDEMNAEDREKQREESELLRPRKERKG
ncbi:hypothetical protein Pmani_034797 [Petrolisthes manimaculis]|uniref:Uncharacterized protein n=1 Tax=Petrolisthes manimaculis TaxID=1843537 RepID=A0AAE1NP88_9EUCA|nr:hypothetical protein Pmani_034797 [Petrolisthes manimaculis]